MKKTFWIVSNFTNRGGSGRANIVFATDEASSVAELVKLIQNRGIVYGEKIEFRVEEDGRRIIHRRQAFGLTAGAIASVQEFDHPLFEVEQQMGRIRPQLGPTP